MSRYIAALDARGTRARTSLASVAIAVTVGATLAWPALDGANAASRVSAHADARAPEYARLADIPSHARVYRASLVPTSRAIPQGRALTWTLEVRTANGTAVRGASLVMESWMPSDSLAAATRLGAITELGDGRYRVEGVRFDGRGWWNLRLSISAAGTTDSLAFNLVL